jgi:hypothetical protein
LIQNRLLLLAITSCALLAQAQSVEPLRETRLSGLKVRSGPSATVANPPVANPESSMSWIGQMLSWFPADTETVMAMTGPFVMPKITQDGNGFMSIANSGDQVRDTLKQYSLLQLLPLAKNFKDEPVIAAMEGSRDFRPPSGLGMALFQGAAIAVFADDVTDQAGAFLKDSRSTILQTEQIEGQSVAVFKKKSEEDIWTTYIAFPKPNVAVVSTDEAYLREVLARINGQQGKRALPDVLPEWKHVNRQAPFWAVRHFRINGKASLTSGFNCVMPGMKPDDQAIGLTFTFDPDKSKTATITYLSPNETTLQTIQKSLFNEREQGVSEMHAQYREPQSGVLDGTYSLEKAESAQYFMFVLEALLGHAIFV